MIGTTLTKHEVLSVLFPHLYYHPDCAPKKCYHCGGEEFSETAYYMDHYVVEVKLKCKCGRTVGYWAYGSYDPYFTSFPMTFKERIKTVWNLINRR